MGLDAYAEMVKKRLAAYVYPVLVIAFSVGASSLWAVSDKLNPETPARAICFYGSQIRHNLNIIPNFPFDLILPEKEAGFCVDELGKALYAKPNTRVFRTGYLHGFMNKESKNYSASGYREYMDKLKLLNW